MATGFSYIFLKGDLLDPKIVFLLGDVFLPLFTFKVCSYTVHFNTYIDFYVFYCSSFVAPQIILQGVWRSLAGITVGANVILLT